MFKNLELIPGKIFRIRYDFGADSVTISRDGGGESCPGKEARHASNSKLEARFEALEGALNHYILNQNISKQRFSMPVPSRRRFPVWKTALSLAVELP